MPAFFLLRMNDHLQYLKKVKATLDGVGDFRGSDHRSCKFGLWIDGAGPREVSDLGPAAMSVFDSVLVPHEQFHTASARALAFQAEGRVAETEREVTEMHMLSGRMVEKLLELDTLAAGSI
jgi:hypothetical protein